MRRFWMTGTAMGLLDWGKEASKWGLINGILLGSWSHIGMVLRQYGVSGDVSFKEHALVLRTVILPDDFDSLLDTTYDNVVFSSFRRLYHGAHEGSMEELFL